MEYSISVINNFGGFGSDAWAINDSGIVVGDASGSGFRHAMRFKNGQLTDLTPSSGITVSTAHGINNLAEAQIVGELKQGSTKAFLWSNGVLTDLHELLGGQWSIAQDINDDGMVAGTRGNEKAQAFIFDPSDQSITTPFPDNTISFGQAINAHGYLVGRALNLPQGFFYDGNLHMLPTLGGNATDPSDINDIGLIVGASHIPGQSRHAFVHDVHGIHDIHTLNGNYSKAWAINNHNVIVGEVNTGNGIVPFIREPGESMVELSTVIKNPTGWDELWRATGINDDGAICGTGVYYGEYRAFLLTPVPVSIFDRVRADLPILVAEVLFGVGTGGGGVIIVGGKPIPIDPPLPFHRITTQQRQLLSRLIAEHMIESNGTPVNMERMIRDVYKEGVRNHRKFNEKLIF